MPGQPGRAEFLTRLWFPTSIGHRVALAAQLFLGQRDERVDELGRPAERDEVAARNLVHLDPEPLPRDPSLEREREEAVVATLDEVRRYRRPGVERLDDDDGVLREPGVVVVSRQVDGGSRRDRAARARR